MARVEKLYAAYKAGYLGDNIFDTYFLFIANMIQEEHILVVEDQDIINRFHERYGIDLSLPFVHQVLGVGIQNNCFNYNFGKYTVDFEEISKYHFEAYDFEKLWEKLKSKFQEYCNRIEIKITKNNVEEVILDALDDSDSLILTGNDFASDDSLLPEKYAWYSFVKKLADEDENLYEFIAKLSASNILKQALFYVSDTAPNYRGLNVYLDSPIVFSLLGMDDDARTKSYKKLVEDMVRAGCNVQVLDNDFQEIDGIIARASTWATSTSYDIVKANNATRFFHDNQMDESEMVEFCDSLETRLNELNITIKETHYDVYQDSFQEDETLLFEMIKDNYLKNGHKLTSDQEKSILVDVRSIIMIYRERKGQVSTRIDMSKHLMLTSNNAIANVSKQYESNRSLNAGHIPPCISADFFGAILWLNSPMQLIEYHKRKVLADCYRYLRPSKKLLEKYIQSLDEARDADEIDEKKFLFLRTHKVVLDSLMNITKGDYARFNSKTYLEVYDDIKNQAMKKYSDEVTAHKQTKEENEKRSQEYQKEIQNLKARVSELEKQDEIQIKKRIKYWKTTLIILLCFVPYVFAVAVIDVLKTKIFSLGGLIILAVASFIVANLYKHGEKWCNNLAIKICDRKK